jgi:hypothetical protein
MPVDSTVQTSDCDHAGGALLLDGPATAKALGIGLSLLYNLDRSGALGPPGVKLGARPSWAAGRIEKLENCLDGLPVGDRMHSMKRIASNLFIQSKHPGTGKVCPQGWPRRDTASLTPVPTYLKGCSNGTYRTRAERQT